MSNHTPGPWRWWDHAGQQGLSCLAGSDQDWPVLMAAVPNGDIWPIILIRNPADKSLIEAAPDLLAACKRLLSARECDRCIEDHGANMIEAEECGCGCHAEIYNAQRQAHAAIAKAKGTTDD